MLDVLNFLQTYFYLPLIRDSGYNLYNTLVYAILLAVVAIFFIPYILKRFKIHADSKFAWGIFPYFILGAIIRSSEDIHLFNSIWLISPLIWAVGLLFGILTLLLSILIQKKFKVKYHYVWGGFAALCSVALLVFFPFKNWLALLIVSGILLTWTLFLLLTQIKFKFNKWAIFALWAHLFDATVTFTAITFFNFWEKHVLPRTLIKSLGAWSMFPLKLFVLIPILCGIMKFIKKEDRLYYLIVVSSFGIITGLRDLLTLLCS